MLNKEIRMGQVYLANVSGRRVPVWIVHCYTGTPRAGWWAKNLVTGRDVRILSGRRLIRHIPEDQVSGEVAYYSK